MKIQIKAIKIKENEWMPQEQIYFSPEIVKEIIEEENLLQDMACKQNVGFNPTTQTFTNVVFECSVYNSEFIYLINSKEIIKGREHFFAYVTSKNWNTTKKVVLELTIDPITSNFDLFYDNKFKGKAYMERGNNYQLTVNDTHSDMCASVLNKVEKIKATNLKLNKKIDMFIERHSRQFNKGITIDRKKIGDLTFNSKGTYFTNSTLNGRILGHQGFQNTNEAFLLKDEKSPPLIKELLNWATNGREKWFFASWNFSRAEYEKFLPKLLEYNLVKDTNLKNVDEIITSDISKKWLTIPKIFEVGDGVFESFKIDLPQEIKEIDLTNHEVLHNEYFLVFNNLFKIPLNFFKLEDKIYGKRIIKADGVSYVLFYDQQMINSFYEINVPLQNSLANDAFYKYQRDLDLAYSSGLRGADALIPEVIQKISQAGLSFSAGKGFGIFNLINNVANYPFDIYKQYQQEKYEKQKILNQPQVARSLLAFEALERVLFGDVFALEWSYIKLNTPSEPVPIEEAYVALSESAYKLYKNDYFSLFYSEPSEIDKEKIRTDQQEYGNIVNTLFLEKDNILELNDLISDHLYWQGKILPELNPIDNFQLDLLNQTLAKGVYIFTKKSDRFKMLIFSSRGDFDVTSNQVNITDVEINSSENDLDIQES